MRRSKTIVVGIFLGGLFAAGLFNASLFANFAAAMADASQVGSNTVFTIDANDTVTLDFVNKSSLTASNFHFVS